MKCGKFLFIVCVIQSNIIHAACTVPTSGSRIWDIAPVNVSLTDLIEADISTLESVLFPSSFMGTFTVLNSLSSLLSSIENKAQLSLSDIDTLLIDTQQDISRLSVVSQHLTTISTGVAHISFDMTGVFTALNELDTTVFNTVTTLNSEVDQLDKQISVIIQSAIAQEITVVSILDQISGEVGSINSMLDGINLESRLDVSSSLIGKLAQSYGMLENSVLQLESILLTGFSGTFTALETNLMEASTIESLVDAIKLSPVDISGTYTALAQLNATINVIGSQVDLITKDLVTITSEVDILSSKFPVVVSKLANVSSATDALANNNSAIGLLAADITLLHKDYSLLTQIMMQDTLSSAVSLLQSSVAQIDLTLTSQNSLLAITSNLLQTDISKLSAYQINNADAISKLSVASSELDSELITAFTIESLIDSIRFPINISTIVSKSQVLASDLAVIPAEMQTISSKLDKLILAENTINSTTDVITRGVQSSLALASTIDSKVNAIASIVEVASGITLNSKLAVINNQTTTIGSKLSIVDAGFPGLIFTAQDMATDFQETWTILQSISNILTSDQLGLQTVSSKISRIRVLDLTGVYTAINRIIVQEGTVNSQVDVANSLADSLNSQQLSLNTALDSISLNMNTINSQVDLVNTHVNRASTYWGTPIYQRDIGPGGYTITQPGRYYLAEDITKSTNFSSININSDDVTLDLNGNQTSQISGYSNISIGSPRNNIRIMNGTGFNNTYYVITGNGTNIILKDLLLYSNAESFLFTTTNFLVKNITVGTNPTSASALLFSGGRNGVIKNSHITDSTLNIGSFFNFYGSNITIDRHNSSNGAVILGQFGNNCVLQNSALMSRRISNIAIANGLLAGNGVTIRNCSISGFSTGIQTKSTDLVLRNSVAGSQTGILLGAANAAALFNTLINNPTRNLNETGGPNTILGNFAFNANAVGSPNNTNYNVVNSNITNKYQTVSQRGAMTAKTGEWYNINMLP